MGNVVVVDIDGTTADSSWRLNRLNGVWPSDRAGWEAWEVGMEDDPHIPWVVAVVKALHASGKEIAFVTAREDYGRERTTMWAKRVFGFEDFRLHMRINDDRRKAPIMKLELIAYFIGIDNVFCCIEDDPVVSKAFRAHGMHVLQVTDPFESGEEKAHREAAEREAQSVAQ